MKSIDNFLDLVEFSKQCTTLESSKEFLYLNTNSSPKIEKALGFAIEAHLFQKRKSGHPYIIHPIIVAGYVAFLGGDEDTICASLLHDTIEDTDTTVDLIKKNFGSVVSFMVSSLTKEENNHLNSKEEKKEYTFDKLTKQASKDIRILIIKLCDRTHNIITLGSMENKKRISKCKETLAYYVPLANRLGIRRIQTVLENICFFYLFPKDYQTITDYIDEHHEEFQIILNNYIIKIKEILMQDSFDPSTFKIEKRIKNKYSTYIKMQRKALDFNDITDMLAIRIIVNNKKDCYKVMGLIHQNFEPLQERFKDYIAKPKENGYQTLHTTIINKTQYTIENQIRTTSMDYAAKIGIAAHWKYKNDNNPNKTLEDKKQSYEVNKSYIQKIYNIQNISDITNITITTTDNQIYNMRYGDTLLDLIYKINTQLANHMLYGIVNNHKVSPIYKLQNKDTIKIISSKKIQLKCSWMRIVNTSYAKKQIRNNCINKLHNINQAMINKIFSKIFNKQPSDIDAWLNSTTIKQYTQSTLSLESIKRLIKLFMFSTTKHKILRTMLLKKLNLKYQLFSNIIIYSNHNITDTKFAHCCYPKTGDEIMAFSKNNKNVEIHHKLCSFSQELITNDNTNVYFAFWASEIIKKFQLTILIKDDTDDLVNLMSILKNFKIKINKINTAEELSEYNISSYQIGTDYSKVEHIEKINQTLKKKFKNLQITSLKKNKKHFKTSTETLDKIQTTHISNDNWII